MGLHCLASQRRCAGGTVPSGTSLLGEGFGWGYTRHGLGHGPLTLRCLPAAEVLSLEGRDWAALLGFAAALRRRDGFPPGPPFLGRASEDDLVTKRIRGVSKIAAPTCLTYLTQRTRFA